MTNQHPRTRGWKIGDFLQRAKGKVRIGLEFVMVHKKQVNGNRALQKSDSSLFFNAAAVS